MHFFCNRVFFWLLTVVSYNAIGQNSLFQSYDCRDEIEIMAQLEKERILKELAVLDSIEQVKKEEQARLLAEALKPYRVDTLAAWKEWSLVENFSFGKNRGGIPMITELNALHPYFRDKIYLLIQKSKARGIDLAVVESYRTRAKQSQYKSMGRKYTRSGAGKSKHQYGLAIDLVPIVNGEAQWHNKSLWRKVGVVGEQLGLTWGGRWRSLYDPGHFEWTGGLSSADLASGKLPTLPKSKSYPCINYDLHLLSIYWENWEAEQASYAKNSEVK